MDGQKVHVISFDFTRMHNLLHARHRRIALSANSHQCFIAFAWFRFVPKYRPPSWSIVTRESLISKRRHDRSSEASLASFFFRTFFFSTATPQLLSILRVALQQYHSTGLNAHPVLRCANSAELRGLQTSSGDLQDEYFMAFINRKYDVRGCYGEGMGWWFGRVRGLDQSRT